MRIGKNMKHALNFAKKYIGWNSYSNDKATKKAIHKLYELKVIDINQYNQFKFITKD